MNNDPAAAARPETDSEIQALAERIVAGWSGHGVAVSLRDVPTMWPVLVPMVENHATAS